MLKKLIDFGLNEKEARIYLALLQMGPSAVGDIAKRSKVSRTNAYHILNTLEENFLVTSSIGEGKTIFTAENPTKLIEFTKRKAEEANKKFEAATKALSELSSMYNHPSKPMKVHFYEGTEGLVNAYEDTLTAQTKILGCASVKQQHNFLPGYFPAYYERRTEKGIKVECFLSKSKESLRIKSLDKKHLRTTKIVPEKFAISPEINIYDNKVAIISLKEKFATIIESPEVSDAFRKLFELAYERAEQYDDEIG